jgi:hypothetical protein
MRIIESVQGTPEWLESRLGCPSGSGFDKLITSSGKPSTQADNYINQLIAEKLTGETTYVRVNEHMERGTFLEPRARDYYSLMSGNEVEEVGFCMHDRFECGVSPDGLIAGGEGGLEIKCPAPSTHVAYLRGGVLPTKYKQQVMGCLWITEREWWDFVSYHETMPALIVRVHRDDDYISLLAEAVQRACETIETQCQKLKEL